MEQQNIIQLWQGFFSTMPKRAQPSEEALSEMLRKFGEGYGKVKAQIIRYRLLGMITAATNMENQLREFERVFDSRVYSYLGYLRLPVDVKIRLEERAKEEFKYFNVHPYASYTKSIPTPVMDAITEAKKFFPDFSIKIWAIENEPMIKDPAVVAEVNLPATFELAFFLIALWENDIKLSDLVDAQSFGIQPVPELPKPTTEPLRPQSRRRRIKN